MANKLARIFYRLLKYGVKVNMRVEGGEGDEGGDEIDEVVQVIDCQHLARNEDENENEFLLVSQFKVAGEMYNRRADLVGFVNGLPLVLIELKASHKRLENAFHDNLRDYKDTIPQLFWYNAFIILSNGRESRIGSISAGRSLRASARAFSSTRRMRSTCSPRR